MRKIEVLGNSFVVLRRVDGTDEEISKAARNKWEELPGERTAEYDLRLFRYMLLHAHSSPFEQASMTFSIRLPVFVARQFMRHRTFKYNEISGRYRPLDLGFYHPEVFHRQSESNRQGSAEVHEHSDSWVTAYNNAIHSIELLYQRMLSAGISREEARIILPVSTLTEFTVTCDLHNLMHFLRLRLDAHAQATIQEVAAAMACHFRNSFPMVWSFFEQIKVSREIESELNSAKSVSTFKMGEAARKILDQNP